MGRLQKKKTQKSKTKAVVNADNAVAVKNEKPLIKKEKKSFIATSEKKVGKNLKPNYFRKAVQFLTEAKIELKKVVWPSGKQTVGSTAVVIILIVIIGLFLGVLDAGLAALVRMVLG